MKNSKRELNFFFKSYKGLEDFHLPIFKEVKEICRPEKVLYPGCFRHISCSVIFEDVTYVDCDNKMSKFFEDVEVDKFVEEKKFYKGDTKKIFILSNFENKFAEIEKFDLLISMSAGLVSNSCTKYLKKGGYFLVSDAHFDARNLFLKPHFKLISVYNNETKKFEDDPSILEQHFHLVSGEEIDEKIVTESINKPKNQRKFKLKKESLFYLFQKISFEEDPKKENKRKNEKEKKSENLKKRNKK